MITTISVSGFPDVCFPVFKLLKKKMQLLSFFSCPFDLHLWVRILNLLPAPSPGTAPHAHFSLPFTSPPLGLVLPPHFPSPPPDPVSAHVWHSHSGTAFYRQRENLPVKSHPIYTCACTKYPVLPCCLQGITLTHNKLPIVPLPVSCHLVCPWLWNVSLALSLLSAGLQALFSL